MSFSDMGVFNEAEQEAAVEAVGQEDGKVVVKEHTRKRRATHEEPLCPVAGSECPGKKVSEEKGIEHE